MMVKPVSLLLLVIALLAQQGRATNYAKGTYMGCWKDTTAGPRVLTGPGQATDANTHESCIAFCATSGYLFAGTEYGSECYCGNTYNTVGSADDDDCSMPCAGDASEKCGAGWRLSVFATGVRPPSNYKDYIGCYNDYVGGQRVLNGVSTTSDKMTVPMCQKFCAENGNQYAGIEYAEQCFCGDDYSTVGKAASSACSMTCAGDSSTLCGGSWALSVYPASLSPANVFADPHFRGFKGERYDVQGVPGKWFNILTDNNTQLNAFFDKLGYGSPNNTYMVALAFASGSTKVYVNASAVLVDGVVQTEPTYRIKVTSEDGEVTTITHKDGQHTMVENDYYVFTFLRREVRKDHPFFNLDSALKDDSRHPHGLLGQTARHTLTHGKKVVEGTFWDYIVSSPFGSDFKYNKFQQQS